jgi:hypothetical protein
MTSSVGIKRTCFLLVARLCFRDAPYITFPSGRTTDSSLDLVYNFVGLCADLGHDSLDGILDGANNGVFPAGDAIRTKTPDGQEAEGKVQSGKSKVDTGHDPAVLLAELLESLEEGELGRRATEL